MKRNLSFAFNHIKVLVIISFLFSCVPFKKSIILRENKEELEKYEVNYNYTGTKYILRPYDIIELTANEQDPAIRQIIETSVVNNFANTVSGLYVNGLRINTDSTIYLFNIGSIKVGGYTLEEAQEKIREKFKEKFPFAEVNIKLVSFKITILGEVNNQGTHFAFNEKISLMDAIGLAGGVSDYANTTRIKIIRQVGNEQKVIKLDISRENILETKYFLIWPHDIIYVEPLRSKVINTTFKQITPIISAISVLASVINITTLIIARN